MHTILNIVIFVPNLKTFPQLCTCTVYTHTALTLLFTALIFHKWSSKEFSQFNFCKVASESKTLKLWDIHDFFIFTNVSKFVSHDI